MTAITTHVLDVSIGRPAAGVHVRLDRRSQEGSWELVGEHTTDSDGRARDLCAPPLIAGEYQLTFDVKRYFDERQVEAFYQQVSIAFTVKDVSQHYHVPLLLSPFGYSTYRGS